MSKRILLAGLASWALISTASAEVAVALRAGTLGAGLDLDIGLTEHLALRLGYAGYSYENEIEDSDVLYDGEIELSHAQGILDWYVFGGSFRFSVGAVGLGTKIDVVGRPLGGFYDIGDSTFTAAEVGSLRGEVEYSNSIAPYVGIGWGNPVDTEGRVTLMLDIGGVYGGSPEVTLTAQCGTALASRCNLLRSEVAAEERELEDEGAVAEWWPVLSLGLAVRF